MLGTKHANLTLITLTGCNHMVNVVELHAVFISCNLGALL